MRIPKQAKLSVEAKDLIQNLCTHPDSRLGRNGAQDVKQHSFFGDLDFEGGLRKQQALFIPTIKHATDTSNFDPIDPDRIRESGDADGDWMNNGNQPVHGFFEFTFRRFFDSNPGGGAGSNNNGGGGNGTASGDERDSQHPVFV